MSESSLIGAAAGRFGREEILGWLECVADPEIPVLSVIDLGVVRDVRVSPEQVDVFVTPTYSGCPAMEVIEQRILDELASRGVEATIHRVLSPPWTTDWLSGAGRRKLREHGIAPPPTGRGRRSFEGHLPPVACPHCDSSDTSRVSEFGSTPCKASWKCNACLEPFEQFKCI
ncbi:MAG TPA: 1,2-phenylacetyl-CoA epoxidase subunit PaaD [Woeseiaceae bacterium]|nr:1,2-phenylacetyl-CoA epoxidase subunit PaaD [Woeseiaceae bacterium]